MKTIVSPFNGLLVVVCLSLPADTGGETRTPTNRSEMLLLQSHAVEPARLHTADADPIDPQRAEIAQVRYLWHSPLGSGACTEAAGCPGGIEGGASGALQVRAILQAKGNRH